MDALVNGWGGGLYPVLWKPFADFLETHPLVAWLVAHPLWAAGLLVLALLLLAGLWSAIARLTEQFWLALVRAPFQLSAALFSGITGLLRWQSAAKRAAPERLTEIMARLEALQAEQAALLQEMRALLAAAKTKSGRMEGLPPEEDA